MQTIPLYPADAKAIALELNRLLATYHIVAQNFHALHWFIRGALFFNLHIQFDALYQSMLTAIDLVAERILTLGFLPDHTLSRYLELSTISPQNEVLSTDAETVQAAQVWLIALAQQIRNLQNEHPLDNGTDDMLTGFLAEYEKSSWMLSAYLNVAPASLHE